MRTPWHLRAALCVSVSLLLHALGARARGDEDPAAGCAKRLEAIGRAIDTYQKDHGGDLPPHLSALHPKYLPDKANLLCPADRAGGQPYPQFFPPDWRLKDP